MHKLDFTVILNLQVINGKFPIEQMVAERFSGDRQVLEKAKAAGAGTVDQSCLDDLENQEEGGKKGCQKGWQEGGQQKSGRPEGPRVAPGASDAWHFAAHGR